MPSVNSLPVRYPQKVSPPRASRASTTSAAQPQPTYTQGEVGFFCGRPSASMSHFLRNRNAQELAQSFQTATKDYHHGQPDGAHLGVFFLQNGVTVVHGVEVLRDVQRVAGDQGELQRLGALLDRLADLRHFQDQVPQVLAP